MLQSPIQNPGAVRNTNPRRSLSRVAKSFDRSKTSHRDQQSPPPTPSCMGFPQRFFWLHRPQSPAAPSSTPTLLSWPFLSQSPESLLRLPCHPNQNQNKNPHPSPAPLPFSDWGKASASPYAKHAPRYA